MNKELFTIYLHKNKINNKVYIGQTIQYPPQRRWKNGLGYKSCYKFYSAIQKYGWENFEHTILVQKEMTQEEANKIEQFYIILFNSIEDGYNIRLCDHGMPSYTPSEGAVEWMKNNPEWCKNKVKDCLKWQDEHPEEMKKIRQENVKKATEARKKKVICLETKEVFESASAAARVTPKTSQGKICMCCRGQRKTSGGFHWKYLEDYDE